MSLLQNAANSIRLGLEDFQSDDDDRLLSASRNFYAGILLLYKEKLRRLSPSDSKEVLLKVKIKPQLDLNGNLSFVGSGVKTVDFQDIEERFTDLGISVDWKRLKALRLVRNEIEHYFTAQSRDALRSVISSVFLLFREFARVHLQEEPIALVGQDAWRRIVDVAEVYERELARCHSLLREREWMTSALADAVTDASCPECGSSLLEPIGDEQRNPEVQCTSCGHSVHFEDFAVLAMNEHYDDHAHIMDGGDPEVVDCPHCGANAFHMPSSECAACGESFSEECAVCGNSIAPDEYDGGSLCSYHQYVASKDD